MCRRRPRRELCQGVTRRCLGHRHELRQDRARRAALGQHVEGAPDLPRGGHVVGGLAVAQFQAHRWRTGLAVGRVGQLGGRFYPRDQRSGQQRGAQAVEGVGGVGGPPDHQGRDQNLAHRSQIHRPALVAVAGVGCRVQVDACHHVQAAPKGQGGQIVGHGPRAAGASFLVRGGNQQQVAGSLAQGQGGVALQHGQTRRQPAFHVQQAAPHQEVAARQVTDRQGLGGGGIRQAGEGGGYGLAEGLRLTGQRLPFPVVPSFHSVVMPGKQQRACRAARHQAIDVLGSVAVPRGREPYVTGPRRERRPGPQQRLQPPAKGRLARAARDAGPARQRNRQFMGALQPGVGRAWGRDAVGSNLTQKAPLCEKHQDKPERSALHEGINLVELNEEAYSLRHGLRGEKLMPLRML
ncbi:hypothetical protein DEFR109230_11255 [Deinococcus frigens]